MKQGSADDPFADDVSESNSEPGEDTDAPDETTVTGESSTELDAESTSQSGSLPYIYSRDSVKDGRQQRPIFLRDEIEAGIPELVTDLESTFGENVYRTDVMEAAVVIAQENPDLVEAKLAEWGYGWD